MLLNHILYINLEHRIDRNAHIQTEFRKLNDVQGQRINAVKHKVGAIGCTYSHIKCLEYAKQQQWQYVVICEDDVTFTDPSTFLSSLSKFEQYFHTDAEAEANQPIQPLWDVLIIGGNNCPPFEQYNGIDYFCRVYNCQTTTCYVVASHYYDTLIRNFKQSVFMLEKQPNNHRQYALDIYWKQLQKTDVWYMLTPLTVIQYENYSDIEKKTVNYRNLLLDLEKPWLTALMAKQSK